MLPGKCTKHKSWNLRQSAICPQMLPSRPGKRARWIKNDQLSHLLIELNRKAGSVTEGDCVHTCRLCNNQFLLPKRCLSHVMTTHKVPEDEVIDNILVHRREEDEKCAEEVSISDNLVRLVPLLVYEDGPR